MNILLDTQVFIWLVHDDEKLDKKSKEMARSTKHKIFISYQSFFEMTIKSSIGKLSFDPSSINDLEAIGVTLLAGDYRALEHYTIFNAENRDPFDNYLIALAKAHDYAFMTSDRKILSTKVSGVKFLDARG